MKKWCLGIDIGGTSVKFGLFDMEGMLLRKWSIPTPNTGMRKKYSGRYSVFSGKEFENMGI